jgi:hypothetical protein
MYNEDVECGYPFEEFEIESIECDMNGYLNVDQDEEEMNEQQVYGTDVCFFGDQMTISGTVTVTEPVFRKMTASMKVCVMSASTNSWTSWTGYKKCQVFDTTLDMGFSSAYMQIAETMGEDEYSASRQQQQYWKYKYDEEGEGTYNDLYLEAGEHTWSAKLQIPTGTFTFRYGELPMVMTLVGKQNELDLVISRNDYPFLKATL